MRPSFSHAGQDRFRDRDRAIDAHALEAILKVAADPSRGTRNQNHRIGDRSQTRRDHLLSPVRNRDLAAGRCIVYIESKSS